MGIDFSNFSEGFQAKWENAIKEDSDGGRKITKKEFDTFSPADQKKLSALISGNTQALGEIELDKDIDIKSYRTNNGEETATITTYAGKQASEGLLDLTPDTVSRYPDAYMGYLKNGVVTLYDKNGNAIKDKNGNKAKFNFTNSSDSKPTFASWYMEHNNGKFDFKTLIEMQNLDSKMKDLEYVEQDISELMHEIDMDKLKAASEDEKASFFERLDAKAAYKKAQAQDMMKEAQQMLYQASKSGELSDVASAFVTTLMANCQTIDNNVGLVKFKEFVKSVSGLNLAADKLTEAVDDGDDSNLSVGENIVEYIKGFGRGVDNFIGSEAVAFLAALAGGTAIATEAGTAIASAAIGEAVSSQVVGTAIGEIVTAYFTYEGANLAYESIKEAINAETKEQANGAGEKASMATFMLSGGLIKGKKVYDSGTAKIREATINKMVEKYSTQEPSTLMIELQLETNPDAQIAIKQTLRDKGYKVQDRPVDGQTQTLVYSPEGKLVASKTKSKYSDISDGELLKDFNNSSPKDIETQAELDAYAQKRQEVFHELVNERGYIPENAGAGIVIKHPSEVSTPTLLKYANLGKDHKLITTEMKNRGYVQNAEGKWVEGTKSAKATEEVLEDGTKVTSQNGRKTKEIAPDGTERRFNAYGDTLEFRPDKTFVKYDSNGNVTGTDVWENIGGSRMTLSEAKHLWMGDHLGRHTLKDGILPEIERFMEANKNQSVEGTSPAGVNGKGVEAPRTEVTSDVTSSSRSGRGELEGGESVDNIYSRITSQDGVKLDETISLPDGTTEIYKDSAGHPVLTVWKDSQGKIMNTREGVWKGSELIESTTTWADGVNTPARGDVNKIAARYENTADYSDTNPLATGNGTRTDYEVGGKLQCTVFKDNQGKISSVLENMYDESGNLVKTVETKADGTSVTKAESNPPSSLRDTSPAGVNNSVAENPSPQPSPVRGEGVVPHTTETATRSAVPTNNRIPYIDPLVQRANNGLYKFETYEYPNGDIETTCINKNTGKAEMQFIQYKDGAMDAFEITHENSRTVCKDAQGNVVPHEVVVTPDSEVTLSVKKGSTTGGIVDFRNIQKENVPDLLSTKSDNKTQSTGLWGRVKGLFGKSEKPSVPDDAPVTVENLGKTGFKPFEMDPKTMESWRETALDGENVTPCSSKDYPQILLIMYSDKAGNVTRTKVIDVNTKIAANIINESNQFGRWNAVVKETIEGLKQPHKNHGQTAVPNLGNAQNVSLPKTSGNQFIDPLIQKAAQGDYTLYSRTQSDGAIITSCKNKSTGNVDIEFIQQKDGTITVNEISYSNSEPSVRKTTYSNGTVAYGNNTAVLFVDSNGKTSIKTVRLTNEQIADRKTCIENNFAREDFINKVDSETSIEGLEKLAEDAETSIECSYITEKLADINHTKAKKVYNRAVERAQSLPDELSTRQNKSADGSDYRVYDVINSELNAQLQNFARENNLKILGGTEYSNHTLSFRDANNHIIRRVTVDADGNVTKDVFPRGKEGLKGLATKQTDNSQLTTTINNGSVYSTKTKNGNLNSVIKDNEGNILIDFTADKDGNVLFVKESKYSEQGSAVLIEDLVNAINKNDDAARFAIEADLKNRGFKIEIKTGTNGNSNLEIAPPEDLYKGSNLYEVANDLAISLGDGNNAIRNTAVTELSNRGLGAKVINNKLVILPKETGKSYIDTHIKRAEELAKSDEYKVTYDTLEDGSDVMFVKNKVTDETVYEFTQYPDRDMGTSVIARNGNKEMLIMQDGKTKSVVNCSLVETDYPPTWEQLDEIVKSNG